MMSAGKAAGIAGKPGEAHRHIPYHRRPPPVSWQEALPDWMWELGAVEKVPRPGTLLLVPFPSRSEEYAIVASEPTFKYRNYNEVIIEIEMFGSESGRMTFCLKSWFVKEKGDFHWTVLENLS